MMSKFEKEYAVFWAAEPVWRMNIIKGNADYYSTGLLPTLPIIPEGLPANVLCELMSDATLPPRDEEPNVWSS